jgi:poly(A) polymerase
VTTANQRKADAIGARLDELDVRIAELAEREELRKLRPPINGHQVMKFLGIPPGPVVGQIMEMLYERRVEQGPYTEDEAYEMIREWSADRLSDRV